MKNLGHDESTWHISAKSLDVHQPIDCKTVRIFAYSSTREQSTKRSGTRLKTESETGERRFFSLASHARRKCEARALRARKTLTSRFTYFFTDFEKKNRLFCSLINRMNSGLVTSYNQKRSCERMMLHTDLCVTLLIVFLFVLFLFGISLTDTRTSSRVSQT